MVYFSQLVIIRCDNFGKIHVTEGKAACMTNCVPPRRNSVTVT